ncbi:efflux RND transporter periplasmic adaptor subunit [Azospirillum thermophilum]|uniref:efflux RND transporter periplasmic adaptor subunit n=1 Tax=Azospirillum thermophilum TaxID=2202148 RepID=UPI001FEA91E3|nr:efflux RND transporter periplasmic adaptor subunit [Azospirillum thermophilum]
MTLDTPPNADAKERQTSYGAPHGSDPQRPVHGGHPPARRRSLVLRLIVTIIVLGLLGVALYGFNTFKNKAISDYFANNKPPPTPVAVAEASVRNVAKYLTSIGTLAASRQVVVAPEVAGRVLQIPFESGARVKAGDPLVQLNDATEQAELLALKAQARLAELNLDRARDLRRSQATPQSSVDQYQAQLDEINANIKRNQATIAQKLIKAPFEGELGIRQVNVGDYVSPGATLVTLTDLSRLYVNFTLPEQTLNALSIGQKVLINSDAVTGRDFEAQITTIEPQVSAETRSIKVQATMDNTARLLRPGMFANVRVVLPPVANALTVPETAVDYTVYGDSVFVVGSEKTQDGKDQLVANRRPVKVGDRAENQVEIREGLKPGERVVISGQLKLSNGAAVSLAESNPLVPPSTLPKN